MSTFSIITINEPDNTYDQAIIIPLVNGEAVGYLHQGDVDFYRLMGTQ